MKYFSLTFWAVQMETINKLLKKQAPKVNKKAAAAAAAAGTTASGETPAEETHKANAIFVRWVSNKNGVRVAVPGEIVEGPAGKVFGGSYGLSSGKMVEEVA